MAKLPVPMPPPGEMLRRRRQEMDRRGKSRKCLLFLCLTALLLTLLFTQLLLIHRNQGLGMYPTAGDGDLVLARRGTAGWQRDDLVVFRLEGELQLGRIVAVGGDEVMLEEEGRLLVNGTVRQRHSLYPTYPRENGQYPLPVPEGTVYILGDHRTQSRDSRDFGSISRENIVGKVIAIVRIGEL